jgi:predicted nucleic acid-binding protein
VEKLLVDAGPIIAFFNQSDEWHERVLEFYSTCTAELVTTLPVITETAWKLRGFQKAQNEFYRHIETRAYTIALLESDDFKRIAELNSKYKGQRPDLADLSLVVVSERLNLSRIVTIDRRDFSIYRRFGNLSFEQVEMPPVLRRKK